MLGVVATRRPQMTELRIAIADDSWFVAEQLRGELVAREPLDLALVDVRRRRQASTTT
jgi:hypothetical protein